ncbi:MAG: hypothetical protein J0H17_13830 [Rhizobiales bacterium]|nr:hypothetical protein [Hyphomicrobiales bacterium]
MVVLGERSRFHRKFESFTMPLLADKDRPANILDLTDMHCWRADHGGYSFVISSQPENPLASGRFSISIRSAKNEKLVEEFDKYPNLTAAKDGCFDAYKRVRRERHGRAG